MRAVVRHLLAVCWYGELVNGLICVPGSSDNSDPPAKAASLAFICPHEDAGGFQGLVYDRGQVVPD
jgi:hypothetical protein